MSMNKYAQKEQQILEALLQIAVGDIEISEITVQDIATAAGIGKGTIYEYFNSKEEIFEKAIFYMGDKLINKVYHAVENADTFDKKINTLEDELISVGEDTLNIHKTLMEALGFPNKIKSPTHTKKLPFNCFEHLDKMFEDMLQQALHEKVINPTLSKEYVLFVLRTMTSSFFHLVHVPDFPLEDIPNIRDYTNRMIYKSLS